MEYIIDKDKSLLSITFDKHVIKHLKARCNNNLYFYQSKHNANLFSLVKANTGYKIVKSKNKKFYEIHIPYKINFLKEFEKINCIYFLKKSGLIRLKIIETNYA